MANSTKRNGMAASKNGTKNGTKADPVKPLAKVQRKVVPPTQKPKLQTTGGGFSIINFIARLIAWYALYTVLFRCSAVPTLDSPGICHPAYTIKIALRPHVQPYYDTYVAPFVQQYSPYVQKANRDYVIPAYRTVHTSYRLYGEPYVAKGSNYAVAEYNRFLKPHVTTAQCKVEDYVNIYVSPHAEKANKVWINDVKPSFDVVEEKVGIFWKDNVLPSYNAIQPYLAKAYEQGKYVILTIVAPVVKEAGEKGVGWCRGVWSEVVRPQVGRIGERLGGTNGNGVPTSAVSESLFSSLSTARQSKEAASEASISSVISSASAPKAPDEASGAPNQPKKMTKAEAKEMIKNDLISWSAKFKSSSVKTVADLGSQIGEISEKAYNDKRDIVEKELASLQKLVDDGLANLKAEVISLASQLESDSTPEEKNAAEDKLFAATRLLGTQILDMAQSLRKDSEKYLAKVYDDVSEATHQHLEVLDSVNDLGMQELGMKWAWMDHVGYKDWAKYHDLKKEIRESRIAIIKSAESNEKLLEITHWVEDAWEAKATDIAKYAAEELRLVKRIGKKKIELADASDDFTDNHIPIVAKKATQQVLGGADKLKNAVVGEEMKEDTIKEKIVNAAGEAKVKLEGIVSPSSTPASESIFSTAYSAVQKSIASQASEKIYSTEPSAAEKIFTVLSKAVESASSVAVESVKAKIPGGVHAGFVANAESIVYDEGVQSRLAEASKAVSQAVKDALGRETTTKTSLPESRQSRASELHASAISVASSILYGTPTPLKECASVATNRNSAEAAGSTEAHRASIISSAQVKYEQTKADGKKAYDSWFYAASTQIYGTPTPATESYLSRASPSAASAASDIGESTTSGAKQTQDLRCVAFEKVYGTPAPSGVSASAASLVSEAAESIASATDNAQELAAVRYAELQSLVNELIHGKEPTFSESVMKRFSSAYYGTPTPFLSHASSFSASATAAVASMPPAIDAMVSDAVSRVKAAAAEASVAVYGKEPTQIEKYQQQLRKLGQDLVDSVSMVVYGTEKGTFQRATETAASIASQVSQAASSVGVKLSIVEEEKAYKDQLVANASRRIWNAIETAEETLRNVGEMAEEYAKQAEEAFGTVKERVRDEL